MISNKFKPTDMLFPEESKAIRKDESAYENAARLNERYHRSLAVSLPLLFLTYKGKSVRQKPFERFDEVITGLLLEEPRQSPERMAELLGLHNGLGQQVLKDMIRPLHQEEVLVADETMIDLTSNGERYARMGRKFESFEKEFELIWDEALEEGRYGSELAKRLRELSKKTLGEEEGHPAEWHSMDWVRSLAEKQAAQIHNPARSVFLEEIAPKLKVERRFFQLQLALYEDFVHKRMVFRAFDRGQKEIEFLSTCLKSEAGRKFYEQQLEHFEKYAPEESEAETQVEDWQQKLETERAQAHAAGKAKADFEAEIKDFNTLSFEKEFERIVRSRPRSIWLISPWIRKTAFRKRKKQIEKMLQSGTVVYLGYSEPVDNMDPECKKELDQMQARYPNLFCHALPEFHEKILLLEDRAGERCYYTGSFNILSFYHHRHKKYRQENMVRLPWSQGATQKLRHYEGHFAHYESRRMKAEIQEMSLPQPPEEAVLKEFQKHLRQWKKDGHRKKLLKAGQQWEQVENALENFELELMMGWEEWGTQEMQEIGEKMKAKTSLTQKEAQSFKNRCAEVQQRLQKLDLTLALPENFEEELKVRRQTFLLQQLRGRLPQKAGSVQQLADLKKEFEALVAEEFIAHSAFETLRTEIREWLDSRVLAGLKVKGKINLDEHSTKKKNNPKKRK